MSSIPNPVVRYLILCEEVLTDPDNDRRVTLVNLISSIRSTVEQPAPPFPIVREEICVYVELTECRGSGDCRIEIVRDDTEGEVPVFQTRTRTVPFGQDPLDIVALSFRLRNITFTEAGLYWVRFCYNETVISSQALLLRE